MLSAMLSIVFLVLGFATHDPNYILYFIASGLFAIASNIGDGKGGDQDDT